MAYGKNQRLRFKRRRDGETDYRRRMKLLRGEPEGCSKNIKYSDNMSISRIQSRRRYCNCVSEW